MLVISVFIIIVLILIWLNSERLVRNTRSTDKYFNDIRDRLDRLIENKQKT